MINIAEKLNNNWMDKCLEIPENMPRNVVENFGFDYYSPLVTRSPKIKEILQLVKKIAKNNSSLLIQGETGTGKELIVDLIQFISYRKLKPYIKVNCAAFPDSLLESELFGHENGVFNGTCQQRIGKFEQANEGTLFLDEIGNTNPITQSKILRVMRDKEFTRVDGKKTIQIDVRIIAATNKNLGQEIERRNFRLELYYGLNIITIELPPLRERREDILPIAEFFRRKFSKELRKPTRSFTKETKYLLENHSWFGNIRELKNLVERAVLVVDDGEEISVDDLALSGKDYFLAGGRNRRKNLENKNQKLYNLKKQEKEHIFNALEISRWKQKDAAIMLGISNRLLNNKIKHHGIKYAG